MTSKKLRQKFLDFFKKNKHTIVPSSSLLPTDPSVLFTTAGMQQFKPYYLGEKSPFGPNAASCQKCVRTSDIEEVGDESHLTFFEMLGNFNFGGHEGISPSARFNGASYFKEEAIKFGHDFIVKKLGLEIDYVTIFDSAPVAEGDWRKGVPSDEESFNLWKELGIPEEKIKKEGIDNFWGPTGQEGPCGPTTEIYVNGIEIWNIVFNEYFCDQEKKLKKLDTPGVDTGMGLERLAVMVQKKDTVFETDLFEPIIAEIKKSAGESDIRSIRIVADHIKAAVFIAAEGVLPSNVERGYILRRLIRRVVRYGKLLKLPENFSESLVKKVVEIYKDVYPEIKEKEQEVLSVIKTEQEKFERTLERGIKEIEKTETMNGETAFHIYETYGFPLELTEEIKKVENRESFFEALKKHQELSRTASAGMFKGGLADASEETTKLHTAAHLMLAALRKVLGNHVSQKGSNINSERLRFDFSHPEKLTDEQKAEVEKLVNEAIEKDLPVICEEMDLEKAKESGAVGVFESKYGDKVKIYVIDDVSREICAGPHVQRTSELGNFKIIKEESSGAGVRRIRAILE